MRAAAVTPGKPGGRCGRRPFLSSQRGIIIGPVVRIAKTLRLVSEYFAQRIPHHDAIATNQPALDEGHSDENSGSFHHF